MTTVVIGAGFAGMTAARDVRKAGGQVVVLEARDRTGGRPEMERRFAVFPAGFGAEDILGDLVPTWLLVREFGQYIPHWHKHKRKGFLACLAEKLLRAAAKTHGLSSGSGMLCSKRLPDAAPARDGGERVAVMYGADLAGEYAALEILTAHSALAGISSNQKKEDSYGRQLNPQHRSQST